jgi:hypothetical protein
MTDALRELFYLLVDNVALENELILLHLGISDHEMRNQYPLQYYEWGCHHQKKYPVWSLVEYGKMVVLMMTTFRRNSPLPFFLHRASAFLSQPFFINKLV